MAFPRCESLPSVNIDDLPYKTYHIIAVTKMQFATECCWKQHSALRKMMASTSAHLGTLIASAGYMRRHTGLIMHLKMVRLPVSISRKLEKSGID